MLKYLVQANAITTIPIGVLLLFCTVIFLVLCWTYRPGSKRYYESIALSLFGQGDTHDEKNESSDVGPIRPYVVDGIEECDNPLPKWWVVLFILTIIFGFIYIIYFHVLSGNSDIERFNFAVAARQEQILAAAENAAKGPSLAEKIKDPALIKAGLQTYTTNCSPCHGANGEGTIGPNLTDNAWLHGGAPQDILNILNKGVVAKGMPPWKDILSPSQLEELVALIVSWRGKNVPGKPLQGEPYEAAE